MPVKLDVGIAGQQRKPAKQPARKVIQSLSHLINIVEARNLASSLHEAVIKVASSYPEGALDRIYANLDQIIQRCAISLNKPIVPVELSSEPQVYVPAKIEKPIITKKPLFDAENEPIKKPLFEEKESKPVKNNDKWKTVPAAEIKTQKEIPLQKQQVQKRPSDDEIFDMFNKMADLEPPREGNNNE